MTKRNAKRLEQANKAAAEAVAVANGEEAATKATKQPKTPSNPCLCGCGGLARRGFVSSHDAKLASAFRKLALVAQGSKKAPGDEEAARLTALCEAAWASPFVNQSAYFQRLAVEAGL